jgi:hypothetical protein
VNNNAAAVLVSRNLGKRSGGGRIASELVEIGGSFRIPEVMRKSGAKMVEVGATNKTHLRITKDVEPETALLLKVHKRFHLVGFTERLMKRTRQTRTQVRNSRHGGPGKRLLSIFQIRLIKAVCRSPRQGVTLSPSAATNCGAPGGIILGEKIGEAIRKTSSRTLRMIN